MKRREHLGPDTERPMIPVIAGFGLGLAVVAVSEWTGWAKQPSFNAALLSAIASYWVVFAVLDGDPWVIGREVSVATLFVLWALVAGLRGKTLWLAVGIGMHGAYDMVSHVILADLEPLWWAGFCAVVDLIVAAYLVMASRVRQA